jgi:hypothetical protein
MPIEDVLISLEILELRRVTRSYIRCAYQWVSFDRVLAKRGGTNPFVDELHAGNETGYDAQEGEDKDDRDGRVFAHSDGWRGVWRYQQVLHDKVRGAYEEQLKDEAMIARSRGKLMVLISRWG